MSILKRIFIAASGNSFIQSCLERNVLYSQYLMGIGSGAGVFTSGEKAIFDILRDRISQPYCIFDIGSNKGQFLQLVLAHIETNDFKIHCFEPGLITFENLAKDLNKDDRIKLNNLAIGKEKGETLLHYDVVGSGLASLTKRNLTHFGIDFDKFESVKTDTIDNYCADNGINRINLLKIDIEGHELDALAGAKSMFERKLIDVVTFEFGGCNIDTRTFFQDFWYFFSKVNMKLFRITPSGYLHSLESYKEICEQFRTTNFIALEK